MEDVLKKISQADDQQILLVVKAVNQRYRQRFPDWETMFLSVPVGTQERRQRLHEAVFELLRQFG